MREGGRWFRTGSCWCRTGSCWNLLVQEGDRWCGKAVAVSGLVVAGVCWCRTGNRCCKKVTGSGLVATGAELVAAGICWCRKMVAVVGLVAASAGRWSPVQVGSCWCRLKEY